MHTVIHWFRRDLRLRDNPALAAAASASDGHVLPLFILDDAILSAPDTGSARVAFLLDSLRALDATLRAQGSRLIIRRGEPRAVLLTFAKQSGAYGLYFNRDYTPLARARDTAVEQALAEHGVAVHTFKEAMLVEPGEVATKAGTPYTVYTPYRRQWAMQLAHTALPAIPAPRLQPVLQAIESVPLPSLAELHRTTDQEILPGGEAAGQTRLDAFIQRHNELGLRGYKAGREQPALNATSRLSAYLRFGCIAPAACLRAAQQLSAQFEPSHPAQQSIETWIGELAWRDFYYQILAYFPYVLDGAFKRQYDALEWDNNEQHFAAWCAGRTGYPIVDAAMRQLAREAWMHNRARMIVASFLTKDLLIDWRRGERYFMRMLIDGDHAANNGGWQWAAGTGTDAQPYFRIFNPVSQGQKFDPQGAYVRRYVPELAQVPERYIHTPWEMPPAEQRRANVQIGRDYPAPIVAHAVQRERALTLYRQARADDTQSGV